MFQLFYFSLNDKTFSNLRCIINVSIFFYQQQCLPRYYEKKLKPIVQKITVIIMKILKKLSNQQ